MFPDITFHRTLCTLFFRYFLHGVPALAVENQDSASLLLGDTPQSQESWRILLSS